MIECRALLQRVGVHQHELISSFDRPAIPEARRLFDPCRGLGDVRRELLILLAHPHRALVVGDGALGRTGSAGQSVATTRRAITVTRLVRMAVPLARRSPVYGVHSNGEGIGIVIADVEVAKAGPRRGHANLTDLHVRAQNWPAIWRSRVRVFGPVSSRLRAHEAGTGSAGGGPPPLSGGACREPISCCIFVIRVGLAVTARRWDARRLVAPPRSPSPS